MNVKKLATETLIGKFDGNINIFRLTDSDTSYNRVKAKF